MVSDHRVLGVTVTRVTVAHVIPVRLRKNPPARRALSPPADPAHDFLSRDARVQLPPGTPIPREPAGVGARLSSGGDGFDSRTRCKWVRAKAASEPPKLARERSIRSGPATGSCFGKQICLASRFRGFDSVWLAGWFDSRRELRTSRSSKGSGCRPLEPAMRARIPHATPWPRRWIPDARLRTELWKVRFLPGLLLLSPMDSAPRLRSVVAAVRFRTASGEFDSHRGPRGHEASIPFSSTTPQWWNGRHASPRSS